MPERSAFDYAVLRVVPRVDRGEFINTGLILHCPERGYLEARIHFDEDLLRAICPGLDCEETRRHLETFVRVAAGHRDAGPVAQLANRQRFHWLVSPRSTVVQVSPVHCGLCDAPAEMFEHLFEKLVLR